MTIQRQRTTSLLLVLSAFVLGSLATAYMMSRNRPSSVASPKNSEPAATGNAKDAKDAKGEGGATLIKLTPEALETAGIRAVPVGFSPIGESLAVPGTVEVAPNRAAKITPPAPGKVSRMLVNLGDIVRTGQPLAVLDSYDVAQAQAAIRQAESGVKQAQAAVQSASAETAQAKAGVNIANAELDQARSKQKSAEMALGRQKELAATGAFSQAPLQAAQSELSQAQSDLLKSQTDLHTHTISLQRAERLFKEELISRSELEQAQLEHQQDQNAIDRAKSRVNIAKQALEREQKVFSGDLLTRQAVQTAEAEVRSAQGDVLKALQGVARAQQDVRRSEKGEQAALTSLRGTESALNASRANLFALTGTGQAAMGGQLTLYSPIGGTVTERNATQGQAVERATTLLVIENLSAVIVDAQLPEKDVARVRIGQPVDVTVPAYPAEHFPGVVQTIAGRVDEKTRALPVRCLVENRNGRLRPKMFAKVSLGVGARSNALAVPLAAIDEDGDDRFIYIQQEGGYERRKVKTGRSSGSSIEIVDGLKSGERVVVEGAFVLKSESKKSELKGDE